MRASRPPTLLALTAASAPRAAALAFVFVTVLLDMLAFGIIIPVLPHLVEQLIGGGTALTLSQLRANFGGWIDDALRRVS